VAWTIPMSLGDSHRGYRVLGTNEDYFRHFRYGTQRALEMAAGRFFEDDFEVVLGAEVARQLNYQLGEEIIIAHGIAEVSFAMHDRYPFTIVGILAATGTPVDQTVHTSVASMDAIHAGPGGFSAAPRTQDSSELTAFMVGLESRLAVFSLQRSINEYRGEPLTAILPGVALAELWQMMSVVENILLVISAMVLGASLLGLATMLLASIRERNNEILLLRSIGMHTSGILLLIVLEALLITVLGIALGFIVLTTTLFMGQDWLSQQYGIFISTLPLSPVILAYLGIILLATLLIALIPGLTAYRRSLGARIGD
jgi:putative ABC transport system permease protein